MPEADPTAPFYLIVTDHDRAFAAQVRQSGHANDDRASAMTG
jgi:hypothetical protein